MLVLNIKKKVLVLILYLTFLYQNKCFLMQEVVYILSDLVDKVVYKEVVVYKLYTFI